MNASHILAIVFGVVCFTIWGLQVFVMIWRYRNPLAAEQADREADARRNARRAERIRKERERAKERL